LDNWLKKHIEKQFWHGVESYLDDKTLDFMVSRMYGIENKEDTQQIH
jgi:hypothetical protein